MNQTRYDHYIYQQLEPESRIIVGNAKRHDRYDPMEGMTADERAMYERIDRENREWERELMERIARSQKK